MSTIRDFVRLGNAVHNSILWVGCSAEFNIAFHRRAQEIGAAIRAERSLTPEQAMQLNEDTELLNQSQPLFDDFQKWVNEQPGGEVNGKRLVDIFLESTV